MAAGVAAAMTGGPVAAQTQAPQGLIIQKVIVKVNGEIFTQTELEFRQIQVLRDQNRQVRQALDLTTDPGLRAALADITPNLLLDAVDELMFVQHGRELGVKLQDSQYAKALEDLKKANGITDEKQFHAELKNAGMTESDLRVNLERTWIIQTVTQQELMRNMTLTDEEARQYYNAHQSEFMKPSTVTLREILVAVPTETVAGQATVNAAADEAAKQKIAAIRERALKGEDYVTLVTEASESGTKANGGLIGPVAVADLSPALIQLLEKMKPGDISEPIRQRTGYQLIKLEARSTSEVEPFDRSRPQITQKILEGRLETERAKFLEKLRLQAVIEWKDDAYKKLYETARAKRLKGGSAPAK